MSEIDLKLLREKEGLTQKDLGRRLGVSLRAIQNYEKTGNIPEYIVKLIHYEFKEGAKSAYGNTDTEHLKRKVSYLERLKEVYEDRINMLEEEAAQYHKMNRKSSSNEG